MTWAQVRAHYCLLFSSHFCRFGQPWNPGWNTAEVCFWSFPWPCSGSSPTATSLARTPCAPEMCETMLWRPWESVTVWENHGKLRSRTMWNRLKLAASPCEQVPPGFILYIVSDQPRKWMSIHKLTHVAWQNSKSTKNEMLSQNWLILFFSSNWHIILAYVPSHLDFLEPGSAFCLSEL